MWYVYNKEDSWICGWVVDSKEEAIHQCMENEDLDYMYVG